jgi:hypothetical protein
MHPTAILEIECRWLADLTFSASLSHVDEYNELTLALDCGGHHETNDFCTRMRFSDIAHGREKFKPGVCAHVCWLPPIGYEVRGGAKPRSHGTGDSIVRCG